MARTEFCMVKWPDETLTETFVEAFVGRPCPVFVLNKDYTGRIVYAKLIEPQKGVEIHVDY